MVTHILDTNICIYAIKKSPSKVFNKLKTFKFGALGISAITYSELQFGISKSSKFHKENNQIQLNQFLSPLEIMDYPSEASVLYGEVRAELEAKGNIIGNLDLLIAVHALYTNSTVVTNNLKEFKRVPNLKCENWA